MSQYVLVCGSTFLQCMCRWRPYPVFNLVATIYFLQWMRIPMRGSGVKVNLICTSTSQCSTSLLILSKLCDADQNHAFPTPSPRCSFALASRQHCRSMYRENFRWIDRSSIWPVRVHWRYQERDHQNGNNLHAWEKAASFKRCSLPLAWHQ